MSETVALDKKKQSRFAKKIKNVKELVTSGRLAVKEEVARKPEKTGRGVVYVGHIPHGFYEKQMHAYFSQFGKVTNLAVCRSHKTGRSKGFAFVEFEHDEVAKIVAETIHNYLMFNRRLVANFIPFEKRSPRLFKGRVTTATNYIAKERRNKMNRLKNTNCSREEHLKQVRRSLANVRATMKKLQELGVAYNFQPVDVPEEIKLNNKPVKGTVIKADQNDVESEEGAPLLKAKFKKSTLNSKDKLTLAGKVVKAKKLSKEKLKLAAEKVLGEKVVKMNLKKLPKLKKKMI